MSFCILNGKLSQTVSLPPEDRGLAYGDGIFETMVVRHGEVKFAEDHIERLKEASEILRFSPDRTFDEIIYDQVPHAVKINRLDVATAKVILWRKPGGIFTPESGSANFLATCREFRSAPSEKKMVTYAENTGKVYSLTSKFKTISSLPYVLAGHVMLESNADDVILISPSGKVIEGLRSNIFWIKDKELYTPSVETGCVEGIMRKKILGYCKQQNISVSEGKYDKEEFESADFAFTSNVGGVSKIRSTENKKFDNESTVYNGVRDFIHSL